MMALSVQKVENLLGTKYLSHLIPIWVCPLVSLFFESWVLCRQPCWWDIMGIACLTLQEIQSCTKIPVFSASYNLTTTCSEMILSFMYLGIYNNNLKESLDLTESKKRTQERLEERKNGGKWYNYTIIFKRTFEWHVDFFWFSF